jgi:hypothetical protein
VVRKNRDPIKKNKIYSISIIIKTLSNNFFTKKNKIKNDSYWYSEVIKFYLFSKFMMQNIIFEKLIAK